MNGTISFPEGARSSRPDGAPCPACRGRGEVADEGARIECEACCGTGRRTEPRRSAMPTHEFVGVDPDR